MKRQNLRTVSLIVVTFTYLLIGAAIFGYLESEHELRQREQVDWMEKRVRWKYNISEDDYTVLTTAIIKSVPHKAGIQWKFPGAFYFATTVVTTIGYGHSTPSTMAGRSFCMVYALIGIPLGLVMFQSIGERLNTIVRVALRRVKRCLRTKNPEVTQTNLVMVVLVLSTILMTSMAAIFAKYERWEYFDALYYCFITLTTIGFGDYVALQKESALQSKPEYVMLSLVFILFGLSVVSSAVNLLVLKFLTLNTEDERRDEQIRSTAALDPYELKGVEITMNATKKQLAARAKPQASETRPTRLPSGSSSDNEADDDDDDEDEDEDNQQPHERERDDPGRLVLDKRAGLRASRPEQRDKLDEYSELEEPDLEYCDPDGFHESPSDRMQLQQWPLSWCALCNQFDERPRLSPRRLDLLTGRGHCCFRHELAVCQVAPSHSHQLGACRGHQRGASSRRRLAASRSQHSFSVQCDEQSAPRTKQRARPVASADDEDSTTSSKKLASIAIDASPGHMASSGERLRDQLAPAVTRGARMASGACNHCDRHFHQPRQGLRSQAHSDVMGANLCWRRQHHHQGPFERNQTNADPLCSMSSVRSRPLSESNDDSNQSPTGHAFKRPSKRRSPLAAQHRHHASRLRQQRQHSRFCSCSNDSLYQRRVEPPFGGHLRETQRPLALCGALPTSSSPHLLLNPSRLQEQQLVDQQGVEADAAGEQRAAGTKHNTSIASMKQPVRQSSWVGTAEMGGDKLGLSLSSLDAKQSGNRNARPSLEGSSESLASGSGNVLRNRPANELEQAAPDASAGKMRVPKLLCKCCCEHDECVKYALKQAAGPQANVIEPPGVGLPEDVERNTAQPLRTVSPPNKEGSTIADAE